MKYYPLTTPQKNIWNLQKYYADTSIANLCGAIFYQAKYCNTYSVTQAVLFEMAIMIYLSNINFANHKVTIGVPAVNRSNIREKNIAGMFVSTMPLTVEITETMTVSDLAKQIAKEHMDIFRHQKYPYADILKYLREKQNFSGNLYDVMVSYQNARTDAKMWRKDLADTVNATNERLGIAVYWEHRSFKEQEIDRETTIHIGAIANALERKGIQTERGNINREIIKRNMMLDQAMVMLKFANQEVDRIQNSKIKDVASSVKNEVLEMIAKVAERKDRLDLPIIKGKYLYKMTDRTALQSADNAVKFVSTRKIDSFESLAKFIADKEQRYRQLEEMHLSKGQRMNRLKEISKVYDLYTPIQVTYKESQPLKGLVKMKYDKGHKESLARYPEMRERLQRLLGQGEKITPRQWKAEVQSLQAEYDSVGKERSKTATELAYAEVIRYNKKNLVRELQNESRQHDKQQNRGKRREEI